VETGVAIYWGGGGGALKWTLYDVTTLYFESFKEYEFQKPGFSKDNKPMQLVYSLPFIDDFPCLRIKDHPWPFI
jgi:hypothetical protein